MRPGLLLAPLLAAALGGCSSLGDLAGAVGGTAAAAGSANPAVGIAVGVATRATVDWAIRRTTRRWHHAEQEALAAVIGEAEPGEVRPWQVRHSLPIGNEQGEVRVLRVIETPLALCKEAAFSVGSGSGPEAARPWFVTSACRTAGGGWTWAAAEPATGRWGSLQ